MTVATSHRKSRSAPAQRAQAPAVEIALTPQQATFCRAATPLVAFVAGRGAGKTFAGCWRIIRHATPGSRFVIVAPTYRMLRDVVWSTFLDLARKVRFLAEANLTRMSVRLGNGAEVLLRSADQPDRLRGLTVAAAWIDEASLVPEETLDVVLLTLRGSPNPWLAATFTPKGRRHWTYTRLAMGQSGVTLVRAATNTNPFLPASFLELAGSQVSGQLALQELAGEFVDIDSCEWPAELWGEWIYTDSLPPVDEMQSRVIAVDPSLGKTEGDPAAIVFAGQARDLLWVHCDVRRRPVDVLLSDVIDFCRRYRPHVLAVEAVQFQQLLATELDRRSASLPHRTWTTVPVDQRVPKPLRIRRLGPHITGRKLRVLRNDGGRELIDQLRAFPLTDHDDAADALEMAIRVMPAATPEIPSFAPRQASVNSLLPVFL